MKRCIPAAAGGEYTSKNRCAEDFSVLAKSWHRFVSILLSAPGVAQSRDGAAHRRIYLPFHIEGMRNVPSESCVKIRSQQLPPF